MVAAVAVAVVLVLSVRLRLMASFTTLSTSIRGSSDDDNDYRILISRRNPRRSHNIIDTSRTGIEVFNPTLLELPRGCQHDFVVIARVPHTKESINGIRYNRARQVAMFANLTHDSQPKLVTGEWSRFLVDNFLEPQHHCKAKPKMDKYIGPEDMKLFWTRSGEPLLTFTHQNPDETLCHGMFLIDVRAAMPEIMDTIAAAGVQDMPPVRFKTPSLLRRQPPKGHEQDPRYQREKNWALAQSPFADGDDELLVMADPSRLYRWKSTAELVQPVASEHESAVVAPGPSTGIGWASKSKTCLHDVMGSDHGIHQATPLLSLTLCRRGMCQPTQNNTVLLGMYHKHSEWPYLWYQRRVAVYRATPPYNMLSVSKELVYLGEDDGKFTWTGSMVYFVNSAEIPLNRSHGFLDDEIWLSYGIKDRVSGWIDVTAIDLVADHYLCQNNIAPLIQDIKA